MKISEKWLREYVDIPVDVNELAERLSLVGLEVAAVTPAVPHLPGIVVGKIVEINKHPDAEKLTVCKVEVGDGEARQIVCGAANVYVGMKAPTILPGNKLPDGNKIRKSKLRGVESEGMLCSARELNLGDEHDSIFELPADAPVGEHFDKYLGQDDSILEIDITPNRGDCLGMLGIARDTAAMFDLALCRPAIEPVTAAIKDVFPVEIREEDACPVFAGRVIRGINPKSKTPLWMQERLRRAGIRPLSSIVDVTQYVMIELGHPMHAYDLDKLSGSIIVRWAKQNESLTLLDGTNPQLDKSVLLISDHKRALGLAGIMGGADTAVNDQSENLFLECAFFSPSVISGQPRKLDLNTDAAYRFERGVDPDGQEYAIERATQLILDICGGVAGPVDCTRTPSVDTRRNDVTLRRARLKTLLGFEVPDEKVASVLTRLGMPPKDVAGGWRVRAPSHRFDIEIEEDLVEEIGRMYGYENIPAEQYPTRHPMEALPEQRRDINVIRQQLVARGYQEVITYSFISPEMNQAVTGQTGLVLANPISSDMTEMRRSLWPGLLNTLKYNLNRQQSRVRIFETGLRYIEQGSDIKQENVLAALVYGDRYPEQWGLAAAPVDFADAKGDLVSLFPPGSWDRFEFAPDEHPGLHPGQSAEIRCDGQGVGWLGALHPKLLNNLELDEPTYLYEISLDALQEAGLPVLETVSRFPAIRRDLAVVVDENVPASALTRLIWSCEPALLRDLKIFDVYRGKGVDLGRKSIALSLILQESSRTLNEDAVDKIMLNITSRLTADLGAQIRE